MGGVDAIVFTGGIGEHDAIARAKICHHMDWLGIRIDTDKNKHILGDVCEITAWGAKVRTLVIATDEELMIARDTKEVAKSNKFSAIYGQSTSGGRFQSSAPSGAPLFCLPAGIYPNICCRFVPCAQIKGRTVVFWLTNLKKNGTIEKSSTRGRLSIQAPGKLTISAMVPKNQRYGYNPSVGKN